MIAFPYPTALVSIENIKSMFQSHLRAIRYYNGGHPHDEARLTYHEQHAAVCQLALYHVERCNGRYR
jgi:hypothetical protein